MSSVRYHHGNLRATLCELALARARTDGSAGLALRELARAAEVSPAAVYRHYTTFDHLVADVARLARQALAEAMLAARRDTPNGPRLATRHLEAIGRAYVRFAVDEPGWFDIAFVRTAATASELDDPDAWGVLCDVLDELVTAGEMPAEQREAAPMIAWSAVHGLGSLLGANRARPFDTADEALVEHVIGGVRRALQIDPPRVLGTGAVRRSSPRGTRRTR